jgi:hypothetical protein
VAAEVGHAHNGTSSMHLRHIASIHADYPGIFATTASSHTLLASSTVPLRLLAIGTR